MSVLLGMWQFDEKPVDLETVNAAGTMLAPYAPDAHSHYIGAGITLAYHALYTTAESHYEKQPFISASGAVLTWDGRLDNREELICELAGKVTGVSTDVEIVGASFDRWGTASFAKLLGDWAIAIWDQRQRQVILAKDFSGIRPLYYLLKDREVRWSSVLDPLVMLSDSRFAFNQEYAAGWLAMYPSADATPYVGIRAVPPSCFVTVKPENVNITKYWEFDCENRIEYLRDSDYEEHFRAVFQEAVRRRLRGDRPICCELSGGMDSTSITCMANFIQRSFPCTPEIHTMSFYDDTEPHADERPYFTKVEEQLGRTGCHIDTAKSKIFDFHEERHFISVPASLSTRSDSFRTKHRNFLESNGIRVVLSGIGGDEMTGGVPSPTSELQDLFIQRDFRQLAHKLKLWALAKRKPWFYLACEAVSGFLPRQFIPQAKHLRPPAWLTYDFIHSHRDVLSGFDRRVTFFGPLPSAQANLDALEVVRRQLSTMSLPYGCPYEKRYPFLDRTLLEFLFAIPREQILRPGYRRSLLRRALKGIVPSEVLERRRKAYATRGPRAAITQEWKLVHGLCKGMISARLGILSERSFLEALVASQNDDQSPLVPLMRTVVLEAWLRMIHRQGVTFKIGSDMRVDKQSRQKQGEEDAVHHSPASSI